MQLDQQKRGFSFKRKGPLDMRMSHKTSLTAKEIVNKWSERELGKIFREFGEEPQWRRAASAIVRGRRLRPIETTTELASLLSQSLKGSSRKKLHPATLVFQALRLCVNRELESIREGVIAALSCLAPGGRGAAISFHRLEDRIIKGLFGEVSKKPIKRLKEASSAPLFRLLTKRPLRCSESEVQENPRARSACLRAIEKNR